MMDKPDWQYDEFKHFATDFADPQAKPDNCIKRQHRV